MTNETRTMSDADNYKSLLADAQCRACYHIHPDGPCTAMDPIDINPYRHTCLCNEYVDLEAQSKIIVQREPRWLARKNQPITEGVSTHDSGLLRDETNL